MMYGTVGFPWESRVNTSYDPLNNINGCFNDIPMIRLAAITDGLTNTAFAGERAVGFIESRSSHADHRHLDLGHRTGHFVLRDVPPNDVFKNPFPPSLVGSNATALSVSSRRSEPLVW